MTKTKRGKRYGNNTKKISTGNGKLIKWGNRGGGPRGSTPSKKYHKKPMDQG